MSAFKPGTPLTVCVFLALAVLLGLGFWQLDRRTWKLDLIAATDARLAAPPMPFPLDPALLGDPDYQPVEVVGRLLHDKELYLASRTYEGQVGFHVVTPLRLPDGRAVFIDRGWVPPEKLDPALRTDGQIEGEVKVTGLLRSGGWTGWSMFEPVNDVEGNRWIWADLPAMAASAGLEAPVTALYIAAGPGQHPGDYPKGGVTIVEFKNDHLEYAITWFSLAVIMLAVYLGLGLKRGRGEG